MIAKKVLVTGANGFIGSNLVKILNLTEGYEVFPTDQSFSEIRNVNALQADIESPLLSKFILEIQPDIIYHLAAQTNVRNSIIDPEDDYRVNVSGTVNILSAVKNLKKTKLIFANSGGAIFGETEEPATENSIRRPISPYGLHKVIAHELIKLQLSNSKNFVSLNLSNVYGPENVPKSAPAVFLRRIFLEEEIEIFGDGNASRDWVFIDDVISAMILIATKDCAGDFNISSGISTSVSNLIKTISRVTNKENKIKYLDSVEGEINKSVLSPAKAYTEMKWKNHVSLEKGIEIMFQELLREYV